MSSAHLVTHRSPRRPGCRSRAGPERNDVIRRRAAADVSHRLINIGGVEDNRARSNAHPLVTHIGLDGSFLDDDDLIIRALQDLVVARARLERAGVRFQILQRWRWPFEELSAGAVRVWLGFNGI